MDIIQFIHVNKQYGQDEAAVDALTDIDLTVEKGEIIAILGPSGSGKSTLLHIAGALDRVSAGSIKINEEDITNFKDDQLTKLRRNKIGFVFQDYGLLLNLTVTQNIELGAKLSKEPADVGELIQAVELGDHKEKFPSQMSGGEQQRVSIARALAKKPEVLFCDEPTGSLDEATGKKVLAVLQKVNKDYNTTLVIVTHNPGIAYIANRIIKMNSGKIVEMVKNETITAAADIRWS